MYISLNVYCCFDRYNPNYSFSSIFLCINGVNLFDITFPNTYSVNFESFITKRSINGQIKNNMFEIDYYTSRTYICIKMSTSAIIVM